MERRLDFSVLLRPGEYVQDEVLRTDSPAKLLYIADKNKLGIVCRFEDKEVAKQVPGARWDKTWRVWVAPMEYQTVLEVQARFSNLAIADNVQNWMDKVVKRRAELVNLKHLEDVEIDVHNADKLYPYQRVGVNYIRNAKNCLLADDMGLGKTFQALLGMESMGFRKVLVLAPKTPCNSWKKEILKWIPHRPFTRLEGTPNKKYRLISEFTDGYMISTYETAARLMEQLLAIDWDAVVLDEGHIIKNRKTPRTITIKKLNKVPTRIVLTGTPVLGDMTKAAQELWSILNFLYPDKFSSYWRFVDQHYVFEDGKITRLKNAEEFKAMLAPIMLRRMKRDVLHDLPEKTYVKHYIELYPAEKKVLKQLAEAMEAQLSTGETVIAPMVIAQITRMKQCCISAKLLSDNLTDQHEETKSAKMDALMELIEDNYQGHKIVVFSQFYQAIQLAKQRLNKAGIPWLELTGPMSGKQREKALAAFQNDDSERVMLVTIKAAGVGVDGLQVADIGIFLDQDWTPGINLQAEDRLLRIGQKNNVTIIKLIAEDSIEQHIEKMLEEKQAVFDDWIEDTAKIKVRDIRRYLLASQ